MVQFNSIRILILATVVSLFGGSFTQAIDVDDLGKKASWNPLSFEQVREQVQQWASTQSLKPEVQQQLQALWTDAAALSSQDLLDQVCISLATADAKALELDQLCLSQNPPAILPTFSFLNDEKTPPFVRNNLRLYYGRWLAQNRLYDEAAAQLEGLQPSDVVDPACLLFYQSVAHHRLLNKKECLVSVEKLLENEDKLPRRYQSLAQLMLADIQPLKVDSLDEISRLMENIQRRLEFGRAGKRVRKEEDDVIAKLDKMIEKLEQQQQQSSSAAPSNSQPSKPAEESGPLGGKGPGNVDPKKIGHKADWGNLPPKKRQEALQQISKGLPAHYREVIEEYFRRLARDGVE